MLLIEFVIPTEKRNIVIVAHNQLVLDAGEQQEGSNISRPVLLQPKRELDNNNQMWTYSSTEGIISLYGEPSLLLDILACILKILLLASKVHTENTNPHARVVIAPKRDADNASQKWVLEDSYIINKVTPYL